MKNILEDIRQKLIDGVYVNEEQIRFSLVGRILSELGWNIWNPKEVYTEFPAVKSEDNTKVDIALFLRPNFPSVYIEIKAHSKIAQNLPVIEKQLRDYNRNNTATFTIITDGQHWRFYYSQTQGEFSDKCYRIIDLLKEECQQIEDEFIMLLSKDRIMNDEAKHIAEKYLLLSSKQRAIKDSLSEANKRIVRNPLLNLVQALQDCVGERGYRVTHEEILEFLDKNSAAENDSNLHSYNLSVKEEIQAFPQKDNRLKYSDTSIGVSKRTILRVTLNGRIFQENKAIDSFINLIKFLGIERVKNNVNIGSAYPLIINKKELSNYENGKYTSIGDGYYIYCNSSTSAKKKFIDTIADQLKEKIKVEIITK